MTSGGLTGWVMKVATLDWPGLDHRAVVTASRDVRVWDPRHPDRELARFDGHTGQVLDVAALAWPGLDHPVIVTASLDGTARVWDPYHPHRELAHLALFGMGHRRARPNDAGRCILARIPRFRTESSPRILTGK
jgi:hypothetical protein